MSYVIWHMFRNIFGTLPQYYSFLHLANKSKVVMKNQVVYHRNTFGTKNLEVLKNEASLLKVR